MLAGAASRAEPDCEADGGSDLAALTGPRSTNADAATALGAAVPARPSRLRQLLSVDWPIPSSRQKTAMVLPLAAWRATRSPHNDAFCADLVDNSLLFITFPCG